MPDFTATEVEDHCNKYVIRPGQEPVVDFLPELKRAETEVYPDQDYSSIAASTIDDCAEKKCVKSDTDLKRQCSDCGKVFSNCKSYAVHVYQAHPKARMTLNKWSSISQTQK